MTYYSVAVANSKTGKLLTHATATMQDIEELAESGFIVYSSYYAQGSGYWVSGIGCWVIGTGVYVQ